MKSGKIFLATIAIAILFSRCANTVTPSGGPKDELPPAPVNYVPDSNSVFFSADEIQITFNEYIQLNDVFNQVVISPPLEGIPTYKLKGKTLTIHLNAPLKDSTTYTINFGQSIKDNTEGNILNNFTYVFSTGSYIDSLEVSGKVKDLFTAAPAEKAFVVLYLDPTDTSFTKTKPYYFSKTDKSGEFKIRNIRPGHYKIYAIDDQNFNYYYDLPNEKIAFQSGYLDIDSNISNQQFSLFSENKMKQDLLEIKSYRYGQTKIVFAKNASDVSIEPVGGSSSEFHITKNNTNDTLYYWNTDRTLDSATFTIQYDTVHIKKTIELKSFPADTVFAKTKNTMTSNIPPLKKGAPAGSPVDWDLGQAVKIKFNNPVIIYDTARFILTEDSITEIHPEIIVDTLDERNIYIQYNWKPEHQYRIRILPGATTDLFGLKNDTLSAKLQIKKEDDYSTFKITFDNDSSVNLIFELLKQDMTPYQKIYLSADQFDPVTHQYILTLKFLVPGVYKMRLIKDYDKNGKWTPGDLSKNLQPEPVIFFPVEQTLRANWENEIEWKVVR